MIYRWEAVVRDEDGESIRFSGEFEDDGSLKEERRRIETYAEYQAQIAAGHRDADPDTVELVDLELV